MVAKPDGTEDTPTPREPALQDPFWDAAGEAVKSCSDPERVFTDREFHNLQALVRNWMAAARSPKFPNCCDFGECQCPKCRPKKKLCQVMNCKAIAEYEVTFYYIEQTKLRLCDSHAKESNKWDSPDMKELKDA